MIVTSNGATRSAAWITVEYMLADGTLDVFIADLLETKLRLIGAVESEESCALWLRKGVRLKGEHENYSRCPHPAGHA